MELMHLLSARAKGTALDGNAVAMFGLQRTLEDEADHGEIVASTFESGLCKAMAAHPNGAVAQWILTELQEEAAAWSMHEHGGRAFYSHPRHGEVWEVPEVIAGMERCAKLLGGGTAEGRTGVTVHV